jgi:hypothetical protein
MLSVMRDSLFLMLSSKGLPPIRKVVNKTEIMRRVII